MPAAPARDNIFVSWGEPLVTLSTHMDTVPPFFPFREDAEFLWGRGACDAKGIIAAMIAAAEGLLASGTRNFSLLFVVGEERNSAGAKAAAANPRGSRFLINGEPTENRVALGCKGALRYEITAEGKLAHSAYPELGDRKSTRLNSSHLVISYAVFCLKKKKKRYLHGSRETMKIHICTHIAVVLILLSSMHYKKLLRINMTPSHGAATMRH